MALKKWTPTTDLMMLRRMGKLGEELGELQAVAARRRAAADQRSS